MTNTAIIATARRLAVLASKGKSGEPEKFFKSFELLKKAKKDD